MVVNRRNFLQTEIARLAQTVAARDSEIHAYSDERAELLVILQTHGALEEYTLLQKRLAELIGQREMLEQRIRNLNEFEQGRSALRIEQGGAARPCSQ